VLHAQIDDEPDVSSPNEYFTVEEDDESAISNAFAKMKLSGNSHPDEKYQQVFYIESPEEEIASAANISIAVH
jgi:hypothetical protein